MKVKTIDGEIHGKDKEYIINLFGDFDWLGYKQLIVSPEMIMDLGYTGGVKPQLSRC